jgi:hypothetical protein
VGVLYADEHFPAPVVEEFCRLGHDVKTVQESGHAGLKWPGVFGSGVAEGSACMSESPGPTPSLSAQKQRLDHLLDKPDSANGQTLRSAARADA